MKLRKTFEDLFKSETHIHINTLYLEWIYIYKKAYHSFLSLFFYFISEMIMFISDIYINFL